MHPLSTPATDTRPSARLRRLLGSPEPTLLMDAYDALSARIVAESGCPAIWASGLGMSAAAGLRDNNEASWTQVLETLELMADATACPILADGDTGFGNFNNLRRFVRKLCQRGIAGVCIEDKVFPKANSFADTPQALCPAAEFCGKIRAAKDAQPDPDFVLVARVEALVVGRGMDEALRRAEAYRQAGADAILIHSKAPTAEEVVTFSRRWQRRAPLLVVPTKYADTPPEVFREAGIDAVIWANFSLRAAIHAVQAAAAAVVRDGTPAREMARYADLARVFELTDEAELRAAERRYLPDEPPGQSASIRLAGGC